LIQVPQAIHDEAKLLEVPLDFSGVDPASVLEDLPKI